jgi:hypothetical protein
VIEMSSFQFSIEELGVVGNPHLGMGGSGGGKSQGEGNYRLVIFEEASNVELFPY